MKPPRTPGLLLPLSLALLLLTGCRGADKSRFMRLIADHTSLTQSDARQPAVVATRPASVAPKLIEPSRAPRAPRAARAPRTPRTKAAAVVVDTAAFVHTVSLSEVRVDIAVESPQPKRCPNVTKIERVRHVNGVQHLDTVIRFDQPSIGG